MALVASAPPLDVQIAAAVASPTGAAQPAGAAACMPPKDAENSTRVEPRPPAACDRADNASASSDAPGEGRRPELCRHWARGSCLAGGACRFAHPAGVLTAPPPRRRTWGGSRAVVRNRSKATVLRRHVIDAFGQEALAAGSGVLDVAGGKVGNGGGGVAHHRLMRGSPAPNPCVRWLLQLRRAHVIRGPVALLGFPGSAAPKAAADASPAPSSRTPSHWPELLAPAPRASKLRVPHGPLHAVWATGRDLLPAAQPQRRARDRRRPPPAAPDAVLAQGGGGRPSPVAPRPAPPACISLHPLCPARLHCPPASALPRTLLETVPRSTPLPTPPAAPPRRRGCSTTRARMRPTPPHPLSCCGSRARGRRVTRGCSSTCSLPRR